MISSINPLAAAEHVADLRRVADRRRPVLDRPHPGTSTRPAAPAVVLRLADAGEAGLVRRLAALDDAPMLEGRVLLALIDGEAVAALSLRDARVIANPFIFTQEAVSLLRLRAEHLAGARPRRRRRAILRPRFA